MFIIRSNWTGFIGAPGYTNIAFASTGAGVATPTDVNTAAAVMKTFWEAVKGHLAPQVNIQVDSEARDINPATGALLAIVSGGAPPAPTQGDGLSPNYSGASGAVVEWSTSTITGNRQIRGRTFLVPLAGNEYDGGSLQGGTVTGLQAAAQAFISNAATQSIPVGVWARPTKQRTKPDGTVVPARPGAFGLVTGARVPDLAAILRSRRD